MTTADYFADLPYEQAAVVRELTRRYRGMIPGLPSDGSVPSYQVAVELLLMQRLEIEIVDAYGDWLEKVKATIERSGREYNRETFLRYCRLRERE